MVEVHSEQYAAGKADRCINLSSEPDIGISTRYSGGAEQAQLAQPSGATLNNCDPCLGRHAIRIPISQSLPSALGCTLNWRMQDPSDAVGLDPNELTIIYAWRIWQASTSTLLGEPASVFSRNNISKCCDEPEPVIPH